MGQPITICEYCENVECKDRVACREFYRYIVFEKIRKLENELYCLNTLLNKYSIETI
jgi:hypothetical protein